MKKPNPLHAQPQPLAGQQLPSNWKDNTADFGGTYDRRNFVQILKQGSTNKQIQIDSPTRNARLTPFPSEQLFGQK